MPLPDKGALAGSLGAPLLLNSQQRAAALKKLGLQAGWCLVAKGEIAVIDRNTRDLIKGLNDTIDTAAELRACLDAIAYEGKEPSDLQERIEKVMARTIPTKSKIELPEPINMGPPKSPLEPGKN